MNPVFSGSFGSPFTPLLAGIAQDQKNLPAGPLFAQETDEFNNCCGAFM